jgi:hypothetical protein
VRYSSDVDLHKMGSSGSSDNEERPGLNSKQRTAKAFLRQGSNALSNQLYNTLVS